MKHNEIRESSLGEELTGGDLPEGSFPDIIIYIFIYIYITYIYMYIYIHIYIYIYILGIQKSKKHLLKPFDVCLHQSTFLLYFTVIFAIKLSLQ